MPIIKAKRPVWDTFPGAWYTIGIDAVSLGDDAPYKWPPATTTATNEAEAFDADLRKPPEAKQTRCRQTTYGMSGQRLLGAVVGMHGDENGLIMPPKIAPFQVVICPMIRKNLEVDTVAVAHEVNAELLKARGLRVKEMWTTVTFHPGQKYYDWEIGGVPLRLDIGPRDIAQGTAFAARGTGGKEPLPMDNIVEECYPSA